MIDRNSGSIKINKTIIKPNDTKASIRDFNLGQIPEERDMGNGWTWLIEKNIFLDDTFFMFSFAFFRNKLRIIEIVFQTEKFDSAQGWETWSEEAEMQKLKRFEEWLNIELGNRNEFEWGNALAVYDEKGGFSQIILNFKDYA